MVNRKGVFIGAYVPRDLKETLQRRAAAEHLHSLSEIKRIRGAVHAANFRPHDRRRAPQSPPRAAPSSARQRRRRLPRPPTDAAGARGGEA